MINKTDILKVKGPVLLACNHPNSFLDSIIIDTLFKESVWSLARGDAFKRPYIKILKALKILPVYRPSEGVENLSENYKTFEDCIGLLRNNSIITIFSEGKCINEWHLRPLKKGTARLAIKAWEENIPLKVIPVGINYSSFKRFGKNVFINFGEPLTNKIINVNSVDGLKHQTFNALLKEQLEKLVFEIPKDDLEKQKELLEIKPSKIKSITLAIPAVIGFFIHLPIFLPIKKMIWKRTYANDHYDSVMAGILMLAYPIYLLIIFVLSIIFLNWVWALIILLLFPFSAWSYIQLKPQLDKINLKQ